MVVKFTFQNVFGNSLQNPRHFSVRGREESLKLYSILWSDWPTSKQEVLRHGNRFAARVCRRYFSEGEKRRPKMRLRFAGYFSSVPLVLSVATVKDPRLKRISVLSLYMTKGRSAAFESNWREKFMFANCTTAILTSHTYPYTVHGTSALKDDCEHFWDGQSVSSKKNVTLVMTWTNFMNHLWA